MINFLGGICTGIWLMVLAEYYDARKERRNKNAKRKTRR